MVKQNTKRRMETNTEVKEKQMFQIPRGVCTQGMYYVFAGIIFFNVLDIYFTIVNLGLGAREINPLVKMMISANVGLLFAYKYFFAIATTVILFLLCHRPFFRRLSYFVFFFYFSLIIHQILLFFRIS